jgi:hypothetical protein
LAKAAVAWLPRLIELVSKLDQQSIKCLDGKDRKFHGQ